jgi:transcriptional/translational regulatory protein YebC/TACO1
MQKTLEDKGLEIVSSESVRLPNNLVELTEEEMEKVYKMLDKFEDDDDVQRVFHNMKE